MVFISFTRETPHDVEYSGPRTAPRLVKPDDDH
jgi:hypothetical protein